jgi:hypothetical protein
MSPLYKSLFVAMLFVASAGAAHAAAMGYSMGEYPRSWRESPEVNIMLSARYDYLVQTNARFRHYRMWKECHPITWPGLREHCLSTFDEMQPILAGYR